MIVRATSSRCKFETLTINFFRFQENEENYQVTAIMVFKTGIDPQWEDKKNKDGGEFRIEISGVREPAVLQQAWETLVFGVTTGNIPGVEDNITGVRFVQKSQWNTLKSFRIEIWVSEGNERSENNEKLRDFLENSLKADLQKDSHFKDA